MNDKTILVTGAGGFVGFATVKKLLSLGYTVKALELPSSPYIETLQTLSHQNPNLILLTANICHEGELEPIMKGVTHVIHSAALLNSIAPKSTFEAVNVIGAKNVIDAAKKANVKRFLLVSTSDVFGIPASGEVISEATPYRSWGEPYADTKIAACELLKASCANHDMEFSIIYPGWVYGPGDKQFFPAIIDMLKDKHVFLWHRNTPYSIDFIFIDDLVNAIANAIFNPAARNEDFLILNDKATMTPQAIFSWMANHLNLSIRVHKLPYGLMMLIARVSQWLCQKGVTKSHLLSTTDVKAFGNDFNFSANKARELLGWNNQTAELDGFQQFFEWYQSNQ